MYLPFNLLNTDRALAPARPALGQRRTARGFSLLEVMVVVAILGILASLAAPSFTPIIERWRVRQAAEDLRSSIYYARSEAIKRGGGVLIKKISNNTKGCTTATEGTDWNCGWNVCLTNACKTTDILQEISLTGNLQITYSGKNSVDFDRWGKPTTYPSFKIFPFGKKVSDPAGLELCMSSGGRIRIVQLKDTQCIK